MRISRVTPLALVACAALTLVGCSTTPTGDTADGSGDSGRDVSLEMSWWGDDNRATLFDQVIKEFEEAHPGITVKQTPVGSPDDLFNRLATDFSSGGSTAPDVFALGGAKPQEYGAVEQLLDLATVADEVHPDKYPDFSLTTAQVNDKLYGLPTGGNATAAFVNTDILAKAGITPPTDTWTWEDFIDIANKVGKASLTTADGKPIYGVDLRIQDILGTYEGQISETGVYTWDGTVGVTTEQMAGWYAMEVKLRDGGGLPDPTVVTANWALPPDQQLYTLGQAAITFGYSNLASAYQAGGATTILLPPCDTDVSGVALLPSAYWAINANTAHPKEAAQLMAWFLEEPSALKLILDSRGVPFNPDAAAIVTPLLSGASQASAEYVQKVLDSGVVAPPQPNGGANFNQYSQDAESDVLFDKATPDQAAQTMLDKLSADLAAAK